MHVPLERCSLANRPEPGLVVRRVLELLDQEAAAPCLDLPCRVGRGEGTLTNVGRPPEPKGRTDPIDDRGPTTSKAIQLRDVHSDQRVVLVTSPINQ